jgi:omega-amidase
LRESDWGFATISAFRRWLWFLRVKVCNLYSYKLHICPHTQGCHVLIYPGAFNLTTGPMHWELLQRSRFALLTTTCEQSS